MPYTLRINKQPLLMGLVCCWRAGIKKWGRFTKNRKRPKAFLAFLAFLEARRPSTAGRKKISDRRWPSRSHLDWSIVVSVKQLKCWLYVRDSALGVLSLSLYVIHTRSVSRECVFNLCHPSEQDKNDEWNEKSRSSTASAKLSRQSFNPKVSLMRYH